MSATKITTPTTLVDIVPAIGLTGDFLKYADNSIASSNSRINALMTFLKMEQGTLDDNPDCGGYDFLKQIYFSSEATGDSLVSQLENAVAKFIKLNINLTGQVNNKDPEQLDISIVVNGLPGLVSFALKENQNVVTIINPSYII